MCQLMCDLHHAVYVHGDPADPQPSDVLLFPFLYFIRQLQKDSPPVDPWATAPATSIATAVGHVRRRRITLIDGSLPAAVLSAVAQRLYTAAENDSTHALAVAPFSGAALHIEFTSRAVPGVPVVEHVKVTYVPREADAADAPLAALFPGAGWLAVTAWHDFINTDGAYTKHIEGINEGINVDINKRREGVFAAGWHPWSGLKALLEATAAECCRPGVFRCTARARKVASV